MNGGGAGGEGGAGGAGDKSVLARVLPAPTLDCAASAAWDCAPVLLPLAHGGTAMLAGEGEEAPSDPRFVILMQPALPRDLFFPGRVRRPPRLVLGRVRKELPMPAPGPDGTRSLEVATDCGELALLRVRLPERAATACLVERDPPSQRARAAGQLRRRLPLTRDSRGWWWPARSHGRHPLAAVFPMLDAAHVLLQPRGSQATGRSKGVLPGMSASWALCWLPEEEQEKRASPSAQGPPLEERAARGAGFVELEWVGAFEELLSSASRKRSVFRVWSAAGPAHRSMAAHT
jgi:hypothetical protein